MSATATTKARKGITGTIHRDQMTVTAADLWAALDRVIEGLLAACGDYYERSDAEGMYERLRQAAELAKVIWMIQDGEINGTSEDCPCGQ